MIEKKLQPAGRLAFREEGEFWNAYWAMPETMQGALLLGSIRMSIATRSSDRKKQFMDLMKAAFDDAAVAATGARATWPYPEQPAPDHERTKE